MVVSPECEGYYTPKPGEVIHQGRGKCQKCSRAEELLNMSPEVQDQNEDSRDKYLEALR